MLFFAPWVSSTHTHSFTRVYIFPDVQKTINLWSILLSAINNMEYETYVNASGYELLVSSSIRSTSSLHFSVLLAFSRFFLYLSDFFQLLINSEGWGM